MSANATKASGISGVGPLDVAISAALCGDQMGALRQVGVILEEDPGRSVAMLLMGRVFGEMGEVALAERALRVAIDLALLEGSLPRAVASVIELRHLGLEPQGAVDKIAELFSRESSQLMAQGAIPPALPRKRLSGASLPPSLAGNDLHRHLANLISAGEERASTLSSAHRVPRQTLLSTFSRSGLKHTLEVLDLVWVDAATTVVEQGETGQEAYIVARGELDVVRTNTDGDRFTLARLGNGALFGEMALLSRAPRAASVVATRPSLLLLARADALSSVVERDPDVGAGLAEFCRRRMLDNLLRTSKILAGIEAKERPELIKRFVARSYEAGDRIIEQGQDAAGLHLIASGEVTIVHEASGEKTVITRLSAGDVVGEISLVLRRPSGANVVATVPTVTLHLPQAEFLGIAKRYPELLSHLYELAVEREDLTWRIVAQDASSADDLVLL